MSDVDQQEMFDKSMARLEKLTKLLWLVIAGAFLVGGWAALLQWNINALAKDNVELKRSVASMALSISELKERSYTFREAQAAAERLVVVETKLSNLTDALETMNSSFDAKLIRLEALIQKQSNISFPLDSDRVAQTPSGRFDPLILVR